MKKILYLFSILLFVSCSSSDDSNDGNSLINPPNWIQGTWAQINEDPYIEIPFCKFKSDDFCTITSSTDICIKLSLEASQLAGGSVDVNETISPTQYKLSYSISGFETSHHFIKISDSEIEYINANAGLPNINLIKI